MESPDDDDEEGDGGDDGEDIEGMAAPCWAFLTSLPKVDLVF